MQGLLLIGGRSARMGCQKHGLILPNGQLLGCYMQQLLTDLLGKAPYVAGHPDGDLSWIRGSRLRDDPRIKGPLAGLMAGFNAIKYDPILVLAVDYPLMTPAALNWLLSQDRRSADAVWPILPDRPFGEPLVSIYYASARSHLEAAIAENNLKTHESIPHNNRWEPQIPPQYQANFFNTNEPTQWQQAMGQWDSVERL